NGIRGKLAGISLSSENRGATRRAGLSDGDTSSGWTADGVPGGGAAGAGACARAAWLNPAIRAAIARSCPGGGMRLCKPATLSRGFALFFGPRLAITTRKIIRDDIDVRESTT